MYRLILATTTDDDAPMLDITEHGSAAAAYTMIRDTTDPDDDCVYSDIAAMIPGQSLTVRQGGVAVAVVVRL